MKWCAFIKNFGVHATVLHRIRDIAYNYNIKKPNDEIMGPLRAIPEQHDETLAVYNAFPVTT